MDTRSNKSLHSLQNITLGRCQLEAVFGCSDNVIMVSQFSQSKRSICSLVVTQSHRAINLGSLSKFFVEDPETKSACFGYYFDGLYGGFLRRSPDYLDGKQIFIYSLSSAIAKYLGQRAVCVRYESRCLSCYTPLLAS